MVGQRNWIYSGVDENSALTAILGRIGRRGHRAAEIIIAIQLSAGSDRER